MLNFDFNLPEGDDLFSRSLRASIERAEDFTRRTRTVTCYVEFTSMDETVAGMQALTLLGIPYRVETGDPEQWFIYFYPTGVLEREAPDAE